MVRAFNAIQVLVLGLAGVGAFYAAAHLSAHAHDAAGAVAPAQAGAAASGTANAATAATSSATATATATTTTTAPVAAARAAPSSAPDSGAPPQPAVSAAWPDRSAMIPRATGEPFATLSWLPPPPPAPRAAAVAAAPPAPPVAPPLPFVFVGMVEQGTPAPQAFLSKGETLLIVTQGETIDNGAYRVEVLSPGQIVLTHLATHTRQAMDVAGGTP